MAKYTAELNELIRIENNNTLVSFFDDILTDYPIFNENYRNVLNLKIVKHYYFHEIGFETGERFVFELNRKMGEIMVKYNQLYNSEIEISPLINYRKITSEDRSTVGTRNDSSEDDKTLVKTTNGNQDTTNNAKVKGVDSDTPTSELLSGEIEGDIYASNVTVTDSETLQGIVESQTENNSSNQLQSSVSELTSTEDNYINEEGTTVSESELLLLYRETFLNIDLEIIKELNNLFMLIV